MLSGSVVKETRPEELQSVRTNAEVVLIVAKNTQDKENNVGYYTYARSQAACSKVYRHERVTDQVYMSVDWSWLACCDKMGAMRDVMGAEMGGAIED
ncbi:hypothetical protein MKZ38_005474 [Zalerion maritima]|uniref:Uncharacterized protein n=1 Tax=Zalerion maritima TaxID=339359 RepID=A0AAD5RK67_9PEZI|nr:hypothetical protein MKZ38_005474 [Zalerion maritima]